MNDINSIYMVIIMALPLSDPIYTVFISFILQMMDETHGTHVDDECFDNHDYDDDTDDDKAWRRRSLLLHRSWSLFPGGSIVKKVPVPLSRRFYPGEDSSPCLQEVSKRFSVVVVPF